MGLAISGVEPIRSARRAPVGVDSPELVAHLGMRACGPAAMVDTHGGETCEAGGETCAIDDQTCDMGGETCDLESVMPSGAAGVTAAIAIEEPPIGLSWSRRLWNSTAAFTIGRPPRAPRVG